MKNNIKEVTLFTIIILYFIYCLKYNFYIKEQVIYSLDIWITKIIPSLFPTFIIIDLIYNSNIPYYITKYLHINCLYILSIISGSPSNAYILSKSKINITKQLSVTKYTSLIFTYNYLKLIFNTKLAIIIIILNILSNIILTLLIKPENSEITKINNNNIFNTIINSINKNIKTLITILGTIIFFNTLPINLISNTYLKTFLFSILEITTSLNHLSTINIPLNLKLFFTIISLSTCGLCIESQIKSIINDTYLNYNKYLYYRLLHLIIFLTITLITINLL